jgi:hypothetical protein
VKLFAFVTCSLFFVRLSATGQSSQAVEFVGGVSLPGAPAGPPSEALNGITGGVGVSLFLNERMELVGSTLFTYFPPPTNTRRSLTVVSFAPFPWYSWDQNKYSVDVSIGLRMHGRGSDVLHPFVVIAGGMRILRSEVTESAWVDQTGTTTQFLNIHGTEDIHLFGMMNAGGGVQIRPATSVWINIQATYQILIGSNNSVNTFVPVAVSLQVPV